MKVNSSLITVQSMEARATVRISTFYYGYQREVRKSLEVPFLRVGRMVIYRVGNLINIPRNLFTRVSRKQDAPVLMLRRTLIAVVTFLNFLNIISGRNIRIPKILVQIILCFNYLRFCLSSETDISLIISTMLIRERYLNFLFPNTFYIDISQSSKDMVYCLLLRYLRVCHEFENCVSNQMMNSD